mgnify:CR=1 FL=1
MGFGGKQSIGDNMNNLLTAKEAKQRSRPSADRLFSALTELEKDWIRKWLEAVDKAASNGKTEVEVKFKAFSQQRTEDDPARHIRKLMSVMELLGYSVGWECKWPMFDVKVNWEFENKFNF